MPKFLRPEWLTVVVFVAGLAAADETFLNTDVFELEVAANPQISPDGSRIAYERRSMDIMTDRAVSNIWMIALVSPLSSRLTARRVKIPRSPRR